MTREEEPMEEKLKFVYYYKYEFVFEDSNGKQYLFGGDSDDIYRSSVNPEMTMEELKHELGEPTNL